MVVALAVEQVTYYRKADGSIPGYSSLHAKGTSYWTRRYPGWTCVTQTTLKLSKKCFERSSPQNEWTHSIYSLMCLRWNEDNLICDKILCVSLKRLDWFFLQWFRGKALTVGSYSKSSVWEWQWFLNLVVKDCNTLGLVGRCYFLNSYFFTSVLYMLYTFRICTDLYTAEQSYTSIM